MSFPPASSLISMPGTLSINTNEQTNDLGNFAVYTLVPLPDKKAFLQALNEDDILDEDQAFFAPTYNFSGKTLADICDYHFNELMPKQRREEAEGGRGRFASGPFLVAVHEDILQHGVLLVDPTYQCFGGNECAPAVARCPVAQEGQDPNLEISAISWAVNLQIANMDMYDLLEQDAAMTWPSELPGYKDLQEKLKLAGEELKQKARERFEPLPVRPVRYNFHHVVDPKRSPHHEVEDDSFYKEEVDCENRIATTVCGGLDCRFVKKTVEELWEEIRKVHPFNCTKMPRWASQDWSMHKEWIFVFDNNDGMDIGDDTVFEVALVKVKWDGNVEGKTKEELEGIMPELDIVERVKMEDALARMDVLSGFTPATSA